MSFQIAWQVLGFQKPYDYHHGQTTDLSLLQALLQWGSRRGMDEEVSHWLVMTPERDSSI